MNKHNLKLTQHANNTPCSSTPFQKLRRFHVCEFLGALLWSCAYIRISWPIHSMQQAILSRCFGAKLLNFKTTLLIQESKTHCWLLRKIKNCLSQQSVTCINDGVKNVRTVLYIKWTTKETIRNRLQELGQFDSMSSSDDAKTEGIYHWKWNPKFANYGSLTPKFM